jgi:hypothetical protein
MLPAAGETGSHVDGALDSTVAYYGWLSGAVREVTGLNPGDAWVPVLHR